jgi:hypothetical protein
MLPVSWNLSCWYCCDELLCLKMLESFQDEHPLTRSENITSLAAIFVSAKFSCLRKILSFVYKFKQQQVFLETCKIGHLFNQEQYA